MFEAALKNKLSKRKDIEFLEGIVSRLIVRLVRRMCTASQGDGEHMNLFIIQANLF